MDATSTQGHDWRHEAACRNEDPALFFGHSKERPGDRNRRQRIAKGICAGCPVRAECLDYAVTRPERYGTWGGMDPDERALKRRSLLRKAAREATVQGVRQRLAETIAERAS